MIPPSERNEQPTTAERRAEWEARILADTIMNTIAGLERKGVGSLNVYWDLLVILMAVMRKEARNRGVAWEQIEDRLNKDSKDWEVRLSANGQGENV